MPSWFHSIMLSWWHYIDSDNVDLEDMASQEIHRRHLQSRPLITTETAMLNCYRLTARDDYSWMAIRWVQFDFLPYPWKVSVMMLVMYDRKGGLMQWYEFSTKLLGLGINYCKCVSIDCDGLLIIFLSNNNNTRQIYVHPTT